MEKVSFTYELNEEAKKIKKQTVQQLCKNTYILKFMKQYGLDQSFLYDHSGRLKDYCDVMQKCEGCKG